MTLPEDIALACADLFQELQLDEAMSHLTGSDPKHHEWVESAVRNPAITSRPALIAGLWLYVDDLERSHTVSQGIDDATGALWHGIMHRREGDFANAHHWMRRAASHPLFHELDPAAALVRRSQLLASHARFGQIEASAMVGNPDIDARIAVCRGRADES